MVSLNSSIVTLGFQHEPQEVCKAYAEIRGIPPLRAFATLSDKRHILTEDTEGNTALWDVTSGSKVQEFGKVMPFRTAYDQHTPLEPWLVLQYPLFHQNRVLVHFYSW